MADLTAERIWEEYRQAVAYNQSLELDSQVRQNENFYLGRQWEGLNAPDLDKPVLNFLKRVVAYFVAMIVTDNVSANITPLGATDQLAARALEAEIAAVIEQNHISSLNRDALRDAAVDGDACIYFYYDQRLHRIAAELLDCRRVLFGNPYSEKAQKQPYIILCQPMLTKQVKAMARQSGLDPALIQPDHPEDIYSGEDSARTTLLTRYWRQDGRVFYQKSVRSALLGGPVDTGYRLYPLAFMNWERVKNSYHGQAAVTGLIPNQIAVNKLWAMALRHQQMAAFPKVFYDRLKIRSWSNRVGEAIGVAGSPGDAVAQSFRTGDMSPQLLEIVDRTISYTRDFMGASDAALGNVKPDNTSAIIAVQKASAAPLELQKLAFYQFVEDYVRVLCDMILTDYGQRTVRMELEGREVAAPVNFSALDRDSMTLRVDVGASAYWSELAEIETLDNLFAKGVITDALTYLESRPEGALRGKQELLRKLRQRQQNLSEGEVAGYALP